MLPSSNYNEKIRALPLPLNHSLDITPKSLQNSLSLQTMIEDLKNAIEKSTKIREEDQISIDRLKKDMDNRLSELKRKIEQVNNESSVGMLAVDGELKEIKVSYQPLMTELKEIWEFFPKEIRANLKKISRRRRKSKKFKILKRGCGKRKINNLAHY